MNSALDFLLSRALSPNSCGRKHSTTIYILTPEIKQIETEKERRQNCKEWKGRHRWMWYLKISSIC